ncbi:hypothetical protein GCM10018962_31180 [Dactylosporangium matsuzakiense]|uniref:Uncharacterized protein n=1 Tax=Dactylosporangium matsuzakiense TaxID=53360 RepID=A0A9W6KKR0_9ACTN|nr:hypothetical protein GCM10017581_043820 [Dactylosporangium matsuzakiense]
MVAGTEVTPLTIDSAEAPDGRALGAALPPPPEPSFTSPITTKTSSTAPIAEYAVRIRLRRAVARSWIKRMRRA